MRVEILILILWCCPLALLADEGGVKLDSITWQKERAKYEYPGVKKEKSKEAKKKKPYKPWNFNFLNKQVFSIIGYVLAVALLVFVILKLQGVNWLKSKFKNKEINVSELGEELPEDISDYDYEKLIDVAVKEGNLRLATRFVMLAVWQLLHQTDKIEWQKDKTNRNYLSELVAHSELQKRVGSLVVVYEKVWYGNYNVTEMEFRKILQLFSRLTKTSTGG